MIFSWFTLNQSSKQLNDMGTEDDAMDICQDSHLSDIESEVSLHKNFGGKRK